MKTARGRFGDSAHSDIGSYFLFRLRRPHTRRVCGCAEGGGKEGIFFKRRRLRCRRPLSRALAPSRATVAETMSSPEKDSGVIGATEDNHAMRMATAAAGSLPQPRVVAWSNSMVPDDLPVFWVSHPPHMELRRVLDASFAEKIKGTFAMVGPTLPTRVLPLRDSFPC